MSLKVRTKGQPEKQKENQESLYDTKAKGSEHFEEKEVFSYVKCCPVAQGYSANTWQG